MKITCTDREIKHVLDLGYYQIPRFQRPYSWERDHIIDFWKDIVDGESDYFIGSMVVFPEANQLFGIVDGQQRLTTITMILCALRNAYKAEQLEHLARGIHLLVEKVGLDNKPQFILQTETSYPYFQECIQKYDEPDIGRNNSIEEINLETAFEVINKLIKDEIESVKQVKHTQHQNVITDFIKKRLNEIRDKFLRLKLILIETDSLDAACTIFETMNTRGKDLSVSDLIKSHLIKFIRVTNAQLDMPKEKWNRIRENIDYLIDPNIDTFLLHFWLSRYDYTTLKTLYKKFKFTVKKNELKHFLETLLNDSTIYQAIFDPESTKWSKNNHEIKKVLINLNTFRITQQTPMVLAILREYLTQKLDYRQTLDCLEAIERFHYLFTAVTSQRSSGSIASMYSSHARMLTNAKNKLSKNKVISELKLKMREKVPTIDEFQAGFKKLKFTNDFTKHKKIIQYTLSKIDSYYNQHGLVVNYDYMTIEHIHSQNPKLRINLSDIPIGQVGNLMLIDKKTNEELANKDFLTKQGMLVKTKIFVDEIVMNAKKWDKEEIDQRTEYIGRLAYNNVFKI